MNARIWSCRRVESAPAFGNRFALACGGLLLSCALLGAAPEWKIQFFYDRADSNFSINDLKCPSAQHCVASGIIDDKRGHEQGAVVVTTDGGLHWSQYELRERPVSLFFLSDSSGWMVTEHGLWSTVEGGRSWVKVHSEKGILQTWFLDANHGYASGFRGLVEETLDGGKNWSKLQAAGEPPEPAPVSYDIISFLGNRGLILGIADGSARFREPRSTPAWHGKVAMLETLDAGKTWTYSTVPVEGELAQVRLTNQGFIVSLIVYSDPKSGFASAVFKTPLGSPDSKVIFAERDRAATDIALPAHGEAILATIEPPGATPQIPIPGKLKMLRSNNLKMWEEMPVDYHAVAQRAIIAAPDARNMWVATDTGAILKWIETDSTAAPATERAPAKASGS